MSYIKDIFWNIFNQEKYTTRSETEVKVGPDTVIAECDILVNVGDQA